MNQTEVLPIEIIFREIAMQGSKAPKDLAVGLGKKLKTFMREINPHDRKAKLGVADVLPLLQATGDVRPLAYWAAECGYALHPLTGPAPSEDDLIRQALDAVAAVGAAAAAFNAAAAEKSPGRFGRFRETCRTAMSKMAGWYHAARGYDAEAVVCVAVSGHDSSPRYAPNRR